MQQICDDKFDRFSPRGEALALGYPSPPSGRDGTCTRSCRTCVAYKKKRKAQEPSPFSVSGEWCSPEELKVDRDANLEAAGSVRLNTATATQHSPSCCVVSVEARISRLHVVQHVREVRIHRPADSTAAETHRNRRSKLKPCICSGLGRR